MNSKRLFLVLIGVLTMVIIGGAASVVFGNSFLKSKAEKLTGLKVESQTLQEQQRTLVQAKRDVETYSELESIAKTVVPQEKDQARTVREIVRLAEATGIDIANISFPSSTLGDKPKTTAPAPTEGGSQPAAPKQSSGTTQVEPVQGIAGLYQMDINVQGSGTPVSYQSFLDFLSRLEQNRRTAQVTNLSVTPSSTNRNQVTFSLVVRVYIKP